MRLVLLLAALMMAAASPLVADKVRAEQIEFELERRGVQDPDFGRWMRRARAEHQWTARHFQHMQGVLNRVTSGNLKRVVFQVPIRHGKTEHNTISYAAYRLDLNPAEQILVVSHNQTLALKFSRAIRRLTLRRGVPMSADRNTAGEWETQAGGGVTALGIGAGTASLNAGLILVDDPVGKREDAESEATRDSTWDSLTNDILARAQPETAVALTMSRWHQRDVIGRILDGEAGADWHVVDLPARAEEGDALGRSAGEPLWPERLGEEFLNAKFAELGSYGFASLLQGRPRPRGGGMFQWDWWKLLDAVPATGSMVRYWDTAGTDVTGKNDPDYTAGGLLCRLPDARTAVVDVARFRLSVAKRDAKILEIAKSDRERFGGRVTWWFEMESGIAGEERIANLVRAVQNVGIACYSERATGSKEIRAEPLASKAEAGNVCLCPGEWRDAFRLEASDFPNGGHDDQVDAVVGADAKLSIPQSRVTKTESPFG